MNRNATLAQLRARMDSPGVRAFFLAMAALTIALLLALYSGAAAEMGHVAVAGISALSSLVLAGWVAVTLVPVLARRTPLRWFAYKIEYKLTREGWIYIAGVFAVALAAMNTGNNLLFLILASLIAFTVPLLLIGSFRPENASRVFYTGLLFGVVSAVPLFLVFIGTRERKEYSAVPPPRGSAPPAPCRRHG